MSAFGKRLLVVNASGRTVGSVSRELVDILVTKLAPSSRINRETNTLPFVDNNFINNSFNPMATDEHKNGHSTITSQVCVDELNAADQIVIGCPIYNFGLPASLKAWVDMVVVSKKTFQYGPTGPIGLLTGMNKKAYIVVVSGGVPVGSPMDHATPYLTQVLSFIGITDVTIIDGTTVEKKESALQQIKELQLE